MKLCYLSTPTYTTFYFYGYFYEKGQQIRTFESLRILQCNNQKLAILCMLISTN
jgi:hypothetical protein